MGAADAVELPRVDIRPGRELMALRSDVGTIKHHFVRKLSLEAKRPALRVSVAKVFLELTSLRILRAGGVRRHWHLLKPIRRAAAGCIGVYVCADGIRWGVRQLLREYQSVERDVTYLIAASPNELILSEKLMHPARPERWRPGQPECRAEILVVRIHMIRPEEVIRIEARKGRIAATHLPPARNSHSG